MDKENLGQVNMAIQSALESAEPDKCTCGSIYFKEVMVLKTLSPLVSPTGQQATIPINVFVCDKCGKLAPSLEKDEKIKKLLNLKNITIN